MRSRLRVLTANLLDGRADPTALADLVDELEVDVACVQELGPGLAEVLRRILPGGQLGPDAIHRGLGIACRHDAGVERFALPYRDGWAARLSPEHWPQLDAPIEIVNVHIMGPHTWPYFPSRHTRRGQLAGLLAYLDREPHTPRAVLGDFNSSPAWPVYRKMARRMDDAARACADGARPRPTWPNLASLGVAGLLRIDHCFVSGLTATQVRVVPIPGSDHLGLCVDVQTRAAP